MAHQQYYYGSPPRDRRSSSISDKPRLPSFSHFLRGAGHSDLTRGKSRQEPSYDNLTPPTTHSSLPTPPLTTPGGPFSGWENNVYPQTSPGDRSSVASSRPSFSSDSHRRPNLVLPAQAVSQDRPVRTYSSNNVDYSRQAFLGGRYTQAVVEDGYWERKSENIHYGVGRLSMTREGTHAGTGSSIWGMTKAGKPRKRLSQACVTCREKKIKCDPGDGPKCSQCLRFNRECRFDTK